MAVKDSNTQAIIDAIANLVKETQRSNEEVIKEFKNLSVNTKSYIEKAQGNVNIQKAFEQFTKEVSSSISETISDASEKERQNYEQLQLKIAAKQEEITKRKEDLKEQKQKGEFGLSPALEKEMMKKIKSAEKELANIVKEYDENAKKNNQQLLEEIRQSQANLTQELTTGIKEFGSTSFKSELKESKNVDEALKKYKAALEQQYKLLENNLEERKKLGLTDKKIDEIKEDLYESYFKELENQSRKENLDEKTRKLLNDRIKREKIQAGYSTYEQTYGKGSSISQLAGRLADFTTKRFKQQDDKTSAAGRAFNAGLAALFKGKDAKEPFLETPAQELVAKPSITQKDIEGGEGRRYFKTSAELANQAPSTESSDEVSAGEAKESVNPSAQLEALEAIQQTFEEAKENVPFKVTIAGLDPAAEKGMKNAFGEALKEVMGIVIKDNLAEALRDNQKDLVKAIGEGGKSKGKGKGKDDDGSIIDVEDLTDLIPKGKGFFRKAARGAKNLGKKGLSAAGKGLKYAGKGLKAAGKFAAKAAVPLAVASSAYDAFQGYSKAEENLGIKGREAEGDEKLYSAGVSAISGLTFGLVDEKRIMSPEMKQNIENQNILTESNKKLQEVAKMPVDPKDPNKKKIAYFEAQLDTLEKQKTVQTGDEKAQTERMITVVKSKIEKLKNPPEIKQTTNLNNVPATSETTKTLTTEIPVTSETTKTLTKEIPETTETTKQITTGIPNTTPNVTVEAPKIEASKVVESVPNIPNVTANIPQPKDVTPELNTNNQLTQQTNQILGEIAKVLAGKDLNPSTIAPIMVNQASNNSSAAQTQSPAYQFRDQNRV